MEKQEQQTWQSIAMKCLYAGLIMMFVTVGVGMIWHLQPNDLTVKTLGWIASVLICFSGGAIVLLPVVSLLKKMHATRQENSTAKHE